ncbi:MAG: AAA family ATPase [Clostridia bacterium]|nr:AAA family ATPase [Clostridia bacterium]
MNDHEDLPRILMEGVDPALCTYEEWLQVGMALHDSGHPCSVWDDWSKSDTARYVAGECERKWRGFRGSMKPVKSGTIIALARAQGYIVGGDGHELNWDDAIGAKGDDLVVVDHKWLQDAEVPAPVHFDPAKELITYLETLFESGENVGYVCEAWQKEEKWLPTKGCWDRTAGELIQALAGCGGDIAAVLGDYKPEAGAWIRFNPVDGKGVRDENVTSYRYALVESDELSIGRQYAIMQQLELPIAVLVHSGKKSLHAIVRVDAITYDEYRKRVDYLYDVCAKNGLKLDKQNRNPSRLSRMPGALRDGKPQYIVARNLGQESFDAWKEYIESVNDDLPDEENLAEVIDNLPALSPPLIHGVLRQGHKMLLAGPSKAGKSFALIELCIAIAEGIPWLGFACAQGKVMYVNLELDKASCFHRFHDVYEAMGVNPRDRHAGNITIWNLRGKSAPMDKLAPKLIRRAAKEKYTAIVIDPIYKIITGDENSADQMAAFCNQFDKVATELGCAVIYCHHHSKGAQGGKKSQDRASGSGVFARDPDALLDMSELPITEAMRAQLGNNATAEICLRWLRRFKPNWHELASQDDQCSAVRMMEICRDNLPERTMELMGGEIQSAKNKIAGRTAWRIEPTLREFATFAPRDLWFDYPVHRCDVDGQLRDVKVESSTPWGGNKEREKTPEERKQERKVEFDMAFDACTVNGDVTVKAVAEYLSCGEKTIRGRVKEFSDAYSVSNSIISRKE